LGTPSSQDHAARAAEAARWHGLGVARWSEARVDEAIAALRAAVACQPEFAQALNDLGVMLGATGQLDEALDAFRDAATNLPGWTEPLINAANLLRNAGRPTEAVDFYRQAITRDPTNADAHHLAGSTLGRLGLRAPAHAHYLEALRLGPSDPLVHSSLLYLTGYDPDLEPAVLLNEHVWWDRLHGAGMTPLPAPRNGRDPERRLRVGYVSPDFRAHPVARFLAPIYEAHDHARVEIWSYARVPRLDAMGERLRRLSTGWRDTTGLADADVAAQVRADEIDVLVDLGGHTGGNCLGAFALRPAPVQVSYLGYPSTTGLAAMGHRLTDAFNDPPGSEAHYTEALTRLPGLWCCWEPQAAPDVAPEPPCARRGHVTFGGLQNLLKLNDGVADLWAAVLRAVPGSRLLLARSTLGEDVRARFVELFTARGIAAERIEVRTPPADGVGHLAEYADVDVSLDAQPWSGHTTTCESLWMGVPMVTLRGRRAAGRMSANVLQAVGLPELVADTPEGFVEIAAALAADPAGLASRRRTLREQVARSPLCDGPGFTRGLEAAYRELWRRWCRSAP
jgi:Flp pilus assembly protein TadD